MDLRYSAEDDRFRQRVRRQKVWTSLGPIADFGMLLARTDPGVPKHQGISYFILDMHQRGVEVRPLRQITASADFAEIFFNDAVVPAENLIGHEGQGWQLAQTTPGFERGGGVLARVIRSASVLQASEALRAAVRRRRFSPRARPPIDPAAPLSLALNLLLAIYYAIPRETAVSRNSR